MVASSVRRETINGILHKQCCKCGEMKSMDKFYPCSQTKDGRYATCAECRRLNGIKYYYAHSAKISAYRKEFAKQHRDIYRRHSKKYGAKNPDKLNAHSAVRRALRAGKLKKCNCEVCGSPFVHAHHDDYSKPLCVRWLCALHHKQVHLKYKEIANG